MLIKSSARRWGYGKFAIDLHLQNADTNELVRPGLIRGFAADNHLDAWAEFQQLSRLDPAEKSLIHFSISPDPAHADDPRCYETGWEIIENEFGLADQPCIEYEHIKDGRRHQHRAYLRRDLDSGVLNPMKNNYARNEKCARIAEWRLGHDIGHGDHDRAVEHALIKDGHPEIAQFMRDRRAAIEAEIGGPEPHPQAQITHWQNQQQIRTSLSAKEIKTLISDSWINHNSKFVATLRDQNLIVARGDKPGIFVAVDDQGGVHPIHRAAKISTNEVRDYFADKDLPTVSQAKLWHKDGGLDFDEPDKSRSAKSDKSTYQITDRRADRLGISLIEAGAASELELRSAPRDRVGRRRIAHTQAKIIDTVESRYATRNYARRADRPEPEHDWKWALESIQEQRAAKIIHVDADGFELIAKTENRLTILQTDKTSGPTDDAILLLIAHAEKEWDRKIQFHGDEEFRARAARLATLQGLEVANRDEASLRAIAEAKQELARKSASTTAPVRPDAGRPWAATIATIKEMRNGSRDRSPGIRRNGIGGNYGILGQRRLDSGGHTRSGHSEIWRRRTVDGVPSLHTRQLVFDQAQPEIVLPKNDADHVSLRHADVGNNPGMRGVEGPARGTGIVTPTAEASDQEVTKTMPKTWKRRGAVRRPFPEPQIHFRPARDQRRDRTESFAKIRLADLPVQAEIRSGLKLPGLDLPDMSITNADFETTRSAIKIANDRLDRMEVWRKAETARLIKEITQKAYAKSSGTDSEEYRQKAAELEKLRGQHPQKITYGVDGYYDEWAQRAAINIEKRRALAEAELQKAQQERKTLGLFSSKEAKATADAKIAEAQEKVAHYMQRAKDLFDYNSPGRGELSPADKIAASQKAVYEKAVTAWEAAKKPLEDIVEAPRREFRAIKNALEKVSGQALSTDMRERLKSAATSSTSLETAIAQILRSEHSRIELPRIKIRDIENEEREYRAKNCLPFIDENEARRIWDRCQSATEKLAFIEREGKSGDDDGGDKGAQAAQIAIWERQAAQEINVPLFDSELRPAKNRVDERLRLSTDLRNQEFIAAADRKKRLEDEERARRDRADHNRRNSRDSTLDYSGPTPPRFD